MERKCRDFGTSSDIIKARFFRCVFYIAKEFICYNEIDLINTRFYLGETYLKIAPTNLGLK